MRPNPMFESDSLGVAALFRFAQFSAAGSAAQQNVSPHTGTVTVTPGLQRPMTVSIRLHSKDGGGCRMVTLKTLAVLFLSALLSACGTRVAHNMLADGNTWDVRAANPAMCSGYTSVETCIQNLRPVIEAQARNVCGKEPTRISNCQFAYNAVGGVHGLQCYAKCEERTTIEVQAPSTRSSTRGVDPEIAAKAKRCQEKGGVWINDICQLLDP